MPNYTDQQKAEAIHLWQEHGTAEASRRTGIPGRTITRWANDAGAMTQDRAEKTEEARAEAATRVATNWADFRSREALASGSEANHVRRALRDAADGTPILDGDGNVVGRKVDGRNVQALATAYGILIDKAELLSGHATARIETWAESELDRDLKTLVAEMEDRIRDGQ